MKNLVELIGSSCQKFGERPCVKYKSAGAWQVKTWYQVLEDTLGLAQGLLDLGVKAGDKVAILANTRVEWTLSDFAILSLGAISVPIYRSSLSDQLEFILKDSESSGIILEDEKQLEKLLEVKDNLPGLKWVVMIDPPARPSKKSKSPVHIFRDLVKPNYVEAKRLFEANAKSIGTDREMTYVYTSGTTGNPKGVVLTHRNFLSNVDGTAEIMGMGADTESLTFLPLSHIMARLFQFVHLKVGLLETYAESIDHLFTNIQEVRPHFMVCVPRIFEKVYEKVMADLHRSNPLKKMLFQWATDVGMEAKGLKARHWSRFFPGALLVQSEIAKRLVHKRLQEKLGGRIQFLVSGGAPLSKEIAEFFYAFGILILEGYGLTETTAPVALNCPSQFKFGTVGQAVPGCEIKIAKDGEILVKGDMIFKGYFKNQAANREAFQDGFFATGDIGVLSTDGFLRITDRKKDIIVTSGGKNIAPQNIENLMKTVPLLSQIMVHGDKRKFLSALVVLNKEALDDFIARRKLEVGRGRHPWELPAVYQYVKDKIEEKNSELASYEKIKKFAIIGKEFTVEGGELTPTLKVKRRVVEERYREILDQFYHEG